ncbi:MAG: hypothetical protein B6I34_10145 [Anaerolineaceae bacterium 4572_32.1]|nr:MAG: hypothetical protein B6I34_10145 [Anaerolineaceae bacterium 4572_32.1]
MKLQDIPFIARTRQNHGLEHATIHVLSQQNPALRVVGRTTPNGFYLYGNLTTKKVRSAVEQALSRLQQGEAHLAVHANCGTNLVTAGFLAGLFSFVALLPRSRRRLDQLPLAVMAATLAVVAAQPLGRVVQANVTTTSHVRNLLIKRITRRQQNRLIVHHIETAAY